MSFPGIVETATPAAANVNGESSMPSAANNEAPSMHDLGLGGLTGKTGPPDPNDAALLFQKLEPDEQCHWNKVIMKLIRTHVRWIADTGSVTQLEESFRASPIGLMQGNESIGLFGFHFDVKKFGEPMTRPDLRTAPLRDGAYARLAKAVLSARNPDSPTIQPGEITMLLDGGKRGNMTRLLAPFKEGTSKDCQKGRRGDDDAVVDEHDSADEDGRPGFVPSILQLGLDEESIAARRKLIRGTCSIKQVEWNHVIGNSKICLPERPRKHYPGTNCGDLIQGIKLPNIADEWHLPWSFKKKLYGKKT